MRKLFLCLLLFPLIVLAESNFFDLKTTREDGLPNSPPAIFSSNETLTFLPQIPKVNVVTGEYCEEECDLLVAGIEPLSIRRFYNHCTGIYSQLHGHWRINPEAGLTFNFEPVGGSQTLVAVGEKNGSLFIYEQPISSGFQIDAGKNKGITNTSSLFSGQFHPLNTKVFYSKGQYVREYPRSLRLPEDHCWWEGKIKDGSGRERFFKTDARQWPQSGKEWPCRKSKHPASGEITKIPLEFFFPFQAQFTEERLPNGNVLRYEYQDINVSNPHVDHDLATTYLLKSIKAYSQKGTFLGSVEASYSVDNSQMRTPRQWINHVTFHGSDNRKTTFYNQQRLVNSRRAFYDSLLSNVEATGKPKQFYDYRWENAQNYYDAPFIYRAGLGEKCLLETSYDLKTKKVIAQSAPVGANGQMVPIARYDYQTDHTIVYDGENNKTVYRFNSDKRITAIEKYQGDKLYSIERNEWHSSNGNLLKRTLEDAFGHLFYAEEFAYDKNHNAITHKVSQSFDQGGNVVSRTFSDDGFNLRKTESDRPGKEIRYTYIPGTNLLSSELVYDHGRICKRTFRFYDSEIGSVCIKTIIDDGKTDHPGDLTGVTFRKIVESSPKRTVPCMGFLEEIREKTIDSFGNEILLKRVVYAYHPSGKIAREDHFDANKVYRYSILNEYDAQERLISTTDALGHKTTFTYDANFNLVAQNGPRADLHKEWVYDMANRPVQEKKWQSDGTILTKKKKYDKATRVIASIDECGFETRYGYDALGRVTAIYYPDGATVKKEYDVLGNVIKEIDPKGYETRKAYNFRNQLTDIWHSDGTEEHFAYNPVGTLQSYKDRNGATTAYDYDIFDRVIKTKVYLPGGKLLKEMTTTWSSFNKLSETDAEGITTEYRYDMAGRKISEKTVEREIFYFYDALGRLTKTQRGDTLYSEDFDHLNRLVEKRNETLDRKITFQERYAYDELGNRTQVINSQGVTETLYNTQSLPIRIKDPLGNTTSVSYSYCGEFIKTTTNARNAQTVSIHDSLGRESEAIKKDPSGKVIQHTKRYYDLNGNVIKTLEIVYDGTTQVRDIIAEWSYGPNNRLERILESFQKEVLYLYDDRGRLNTQINPDKTELHYFYDDLGRLQRFSSKDFDYHYFYDNKDRILRVEDSIARTKTERSYDQYGNLIHENLANGLRLSGQFDPQGQRKFLVLPNGQTVSFDFHARQLFRVCYKGNCFEYTSRNLEGKPTLITLPQSLGELFIEWDALPRWKRFSSPYYSATYEYDPVGNLIKQSFKDPLGIKTNEYAYEYLNQIISDNEHTYQHDSLHNRAQKDGAVHSCNTLSQITCDGIKNYSYDANGNLIFDGSIRCEYDTQNRLIKVTKGALRSEYLYDAFNRRLSKKIYENDKLTKTIHYLWDDKNEIGSVVEDSIVELRILGEGLGAEIGAAILFELNGQVYIPIHDHRGSLVTLVDSSAKPVETYRYTAFGEELTTGTFAPWRFSSKRVDLETGWIYFGRRYYCPSLGRWITPDPLGFQDGPNLYAYLHNCPLTQIDFYGLLGIGQCFSTATNMAFKTIEWVGANLLPIPYASDFVESVGRWGAGGEFWGPSNYRSDKNEIIHIPGRTVTGFSYTHGNGLLTRKTGGIEQSEHISKTHGDVEVDLMYRATQGLIMDLLGCGFSKLGMPTAYNIMCANYYRSKLEEDPNHRFISSVHSRGGIEIMNTGKLLSPEQRQHIDVLSYGSATLIPKGYFNSAKNYLSPLDIVCMTNPLAYCTGFLGHQYDMNFLSPATYCPFKAHGFLEATYAKEIARKGYDFIKEHFND